MHRKPLALAVVLLIAGLAPASAIIGFCARMPCCNHAPAVALMVTESGDCCSAVTCYDVPSAKLTSNVPAAVFVTTPVVAATVWMSCVAPMATRTFNDTSPPRSTGDRLAVLSILLI